MSEALLLFNQAVTLERSSIEHGVQTRIQIRIRSWSVSLYHTDLIDPANLSLLRQSKEGSAWLLRDFGNLELNVFNQLLCLELMGFLGPKDI